MESHETGVPHAMNRLSGAVLLPVVLLACGPGAGPNGDAGADAGDAGDTGVEIASPNIPWLEDGTPPIAPPVLTPCPEGWHEVTQVDPGDPDGEMDVVVCDPYGTDPGGSEPDTCAEGEAHFPGDPGCSPVGAPCPLGDFPEGLPSDRALLYVLASAPPGGDGTEASPLSTITEGLAIASRGTIIAIGKGEYDEVLRLPPGVTLWGACASETRLTASRWGPSAQGVITVPSADTRVANLWVGPAERPGIVTYGDGASLSVDGVIINGVRTVGLQVMDGGRVDSRELVVAGTRADGAGRFGLGIAVGVASTLNLGRAWISQNRLAGVLAEDDGTSLTLSEVAIVDTQAQQSDGVGGLALGIRRGAMATVARALFSRNREMGVLADGNGTSLTLSDVIIRDTQAREVDGAEGRGLSLQRGAAMTVTRALLSRNRNVGVFVGGRDTSLTLSDVVVRDTQAQESGGTGGRGVDVQRGATATVTRALLSGNRDVGVFAGSEGTAVMLSDVVVQGTQALERDGSKGRGVGVQWGATLMVTRALLSRNRDVGVFASDDGTSLTLSDVVVRDTRGEQSDGTGGRGVSVQLGATATVTRALLSQNREVGVLARSLGTAVQLLDVVVAQTNEQTCVDTTCPERPFGIGLAGIDEASLSASRFAVQGGALCGVMVAEDAQVDLAVGVVSGFLIGVCLQVDGYSVSRLTDRVRYVDNGTNLDTTSTVPLPELGSPFEAP